MRPATLNPSRPAGRPLLWLVLFMLPAVRPAAVQAMDAREVFAQNEQSIHQIRVVNRRTGKKSSIGSGFLVQDGTHLATNYHVVADFVREPETYALRYRDNSGQTGDLEVVDLDVVHDLALLGAGRRLGVALPTAAPPAKGAPIFAMGNPLDLGLTIAAGNNGGVLDQTDASRILFSGNLNAGMSGGPSFDSEGRVVGINVATARNAISFIVPARYLDAMLERAAARDFAPAADLEELVGAQTSAYQADYLARSMRGQWPLSDIGGARVAGNISPTVRCWDASPDPDPEVLYRKLKISCKNENEIYLSDRLTAGQVLYEYLWLDTTRLDPLRFYAYYRTVTDSQLSSRAGKEDVGRFTCRTWFIAVDGEQLKSSLCHRPYLRYPGLVDVLFTSALVGHARQGFVFNLDLVGTDYGAAVDLVSRMLEHITWTR